MWKLSNEDNNMYVQLPEELQRRINQCLMDNNFPEAKRLYDLAMLELPKFDSKHKQRNKSNKKRVA